MTRVEFFNPQGRIDGFCCSGHSDWGEEGADIVCAAVSTAVQMAIITITDVLGVKARTKVNEQEARITLKLPASCEEDEDTVQTILTGLMLTLCNVRDDYPNYIEVMEV